MTAHSCGDFIAQNVRSHHLYTLQICGHVSKFECFGQLFCNNALFLWQHEDTSSLCLLSDDNSGRQMISNFSLRQRLHLLLMLL